MLAYVFWHWPRDGVAAADYEERQRRFHAALQAAPPPGFLGSRCLGLERASWTRHDGPVYEDWYLLDGSAALDPLNAAAVSASRQAPHDAAAALAAGGTAGLYSLRLGVQRDLPYTATWFDKPEGMSYGALFTLLGDVVEAEDGALWCRQMTLGPTAEFCLHSGGPLRLPAPLTGTGQGCRRIWPEPDRAVGDRPD